MRRMKNVRRKLADHARRIRQIVERQQAIRMGSDLNASERPGREMQSERLFLPDDEVIMFRGCGGKMRDEVERVAADAVKLLSAYPA